MSWTLVFRSCALAVMLFGCGGQAERSVGDSEGEGDEMPSGAESPGSVGSGDTPLGPCVKGFDRFENLDKQCNWLAEQLCYDTKEAACACVCPPTTNSVCVSGFYDGPGAATPVSCD